MKHSLFRMLPFFLLTNIFKGLKSKCGRRQLHVLYAWGVNRTHLKNCRVVTLATICLRQYYIGRRLQMPRTMAYKDLPIFFFKASAVFLYPFAFQAKK